jgi:hypothetical protein
VESDRLLPPGSALGLALGLDPLLQEVDEPAGGAVGAAGEGVQGVRAHEGQGFLGGGERALFRDHVLPLHHEAQRGGLHAAHGGAPARDLLEGDAVHGAMGAEVVLEAPRDELALQDEIDRRENKNLPTRLDRAGFEEAHTFEDFDRDAPVTFDRDRVRSLLDPDLLIIDDFGLRRLNARQSSDFCEVIIERHRRASTIVTSNRAIDEWIPLFDDPILARSALDRLARNAYQVVMEGDSYRSRQRSGQAPPLLHPGNDRGSQIQPDNQYSSQAPGGVGQARENAWVKLVGSDTADSWFSPIS